MRDNVLTMLVKSFLKDYSQSFFARGNNAKYFTVTILVMYNSCSCENRNFAWKDFSYWDLDIQIWSQTLFMHLQFKGVRPQDLCVKMCDVKMILLNIKVCECVTIMINSYIILMSDHSTLMYLAMDVNGQYLDILG